MRTAFCLLMILAGFLTIACQNTPTNSVPIPADTQPKGPLDNVTDPMHQPGIDNHGLLR